jgi:hypothetical protein
VYSRFCFLLLLVALQLTPVDELGMSDLLVDPSPEYIQVEELILWTCVPELHGAQMGVGSILDVLTKKILCRRMDKNELSLMVMGVIVEMEAAIMLEGFFFPNVLLVFLLHCSLVICQALLKLLEADTIKLW